MPAAAASTKKETMAEMTAALLRVEGEKIDVVLIRQIKTSV